MPRLHQDRFFPFCRLDHVLERLCLSIQCPFCIGRLGVCCIPRGTEHLVADSFSLDIGILGQFHPARQCQVFHCTWLSVRLYCLCRFNLHAMYHTSDEEWVFAVAALTLCALVMVTVWMVFFLVQYNRKRTLQNKTMETLNEILKPSSNGRGKKDHG